MDKKNVVFSIIMPCYNSASYVRNAVNSLLSQTNCNWELVAVNDGSTDDTIDILKQYAQRDDRIKVYSKENGGYVSAVNYGLDRVHGDYFLMMGSDDRLTPTLFEHITNYIKNELPDIIAFKAAKYIDGQFREIDGLTDFDTVVFMENISINQFEEKYPLHSRIMFERDTAKCYKSSVLGNLRYFGKYGYDADGIFSTLFTHKCNSFMSIPVAGYLWTLRDDSLSAKTSIPINWDRLSNWEQYTQFVLSHKEYKPANRERGYLLMAINVGNELVKEIETLDFQTIKLIRRKQKSSFTASRKYNILHKKTVGSKIMYYIMEKCPILFFVWIRKANRG